MCNPVPKKVKRKPQVPVAAAGAGTGAGTGTGTQTSNTSENRANNASSSSRSQTKPSLRCLIYRKDWSSVSSCCEANRGQTEEPDRLGDLPLHEVCLQGAPFQVIQNIFNAYPEAIKTKGFCGRLPLHYASYNKPSLHVVKLLLKHYPESATIADVDGRLPIHLAVVRNAPKQVIQTLIDANPKSLNIVNRFGSTPCMLARNDHIYGILKDEESRPRNLSQKIDLEKKLEKAWKCSSTGRGAVANTNGRKKNTGSKALPPTSKSRRIRIKGEIPFQDKNSKLDSSSQLRPILEQNRESIPTPPGTPKPAVETIAPIPSIHRGKPESPTFSVTSFIPSKNKNLMTIQQRKRNFTVPYVPPEDNRVKEAILV